jgi:hypothetical protein
MITDAFGTPLNIGDKVVVAWHGAGKPGVRMSKAVVTALGKGKKVPQVKVAGRVRLAWCGEMEERWTLRHDWAECQRVVKTDWAGKEDMIEGEFYRK